jgi:hypothetical protein
MLSRPEIFRAKAEACRHQAGLAKEEKRRLLLLTLAEQWSKMADEAERWPNDAPAIPRAWSRKPSH